MAKQGCDTELRNVLEEHTYSNGYTKTVSSTELKDTFGDAAMHLMQEKYRICNKLRSHINRINKKDFHKRQKKCEDDRFGSAVMLCEVIDDNSMKNGNWKAYGDVGLRQQRRRLHDLSKMKLGNVCLLIMN